MKVLGLDPVAADGVARCVVWAVALPAPSYDASSSEAKPLQAGERFAVCRRDEGADAGTIVASSVLRACVPIGGYLGARPRVVSIESAGLVFEAVGEHRLRPIPPRARAGSFVAARWAWLIEDSEPTSSRCPVCWVGKPHCARCAGTGGCDPFEVEARPELVWSADLSRRHTLTSVPDGLTKSQRRRARRRRELGVAIAVEWCQSPSEFDTAKSLASAELARKAGASLPVEWTITTGDNAERAIKIIRSAHGGAYGHRLAEIAATLQHRGGYLVVAAAEEAA